MGLTDNDILETVISSTICARPMVSGWYIAGKSYLGIPCIQ
ncbi:MAG: hypothetical protein U0T56_02225 [Ferruginibacter sp.]